MKSPKSSRHRKMSPLEAARALRSAGDEGALRRAGDEGALRASPSSPISTDDDPPPKKPPRYCPWCGGQVCKRWAPHRIRSLYQRINARVAYVCLQCKIAVRAFRFPDEPLFESRKAARARAQEDYDDLEASGFFFEHARERYRQGKCSCSTFNYPVYMGMPPRTSPCPVHAPIAASKRKRS